MKSFSEKIKLIERIINIPLEKNWNNYLKGNNNWFLYLKTLQIIDKKQCNNILQKKLLLKVIFILNLIFVKLNIILR
jgi:hypothetical protein